MPIYRHLSLPSVFHLLAILITCIPSPATAFLSSSALRQQVLLPISRHHHLKTTTHMSSVVGAHLLIQRHDNEVTSTVRRGQKSALLVLTHEYVAIFVWRQVLEITLNRPKQLNALSVEVSGTSHYYKSLISDITTHQSLMVADVGGDDCPYATSFG